MASRTKTKERRRLKPRHQSRGQVDTPFLLLTILLVIIGLVMLLSASYPTAWYDVQNRTGHDPFHYPSFGSSCFNRKPRMSRT